VRGRRARYRGFPDPEAARRRLAAGAPYRDREDEKAAALEALPEDAVFFDSGTGPGRGAAHGLPFEPARAPKPRRSRAVFAPARDPDDAPSSDPPRRTGRDPPDVDA
jgi:hypothetical protein